MSPTGHPARPARHLVHPLLAGLLVLAAQAGEEPALVRELFEPWRWRSFGFEDGLPHTRVRHILEAEDGTIWVGTDGGLCFYDGYDFVPVEGLPKYATTALCAGADGRIGVAFPWDGHAVWIGDRHGFTPVADPPEVLAAGRLLRGITTAADGTFVAHARGSDDPQGVYVALLPEGPRVVPCPFGLRSVQHPFTEVTGNRGAWIGAADGLLEVTPGGLGPLWHFPAGARVSPMLVEPAHGRALANVHLPWPLRGLWEVGPDNAARIPESEGTFAMAADATQEGELLAIIRGGRAFHRDARGTWLFLEHVPDLLRNMTVLCFQRDGDLWVGGVQGLALLRRAGARWKFWWYSNPETLDSVYALESDGAGGHWAGLGIGLEHRPADGPPELHLEALGQRLETLTALARDDRGRLWVGSGAGAFPGVLVREGETWRAFGPAEGLDARCVHRIRRAPDGRMAIMALPDLGGPPGVWIGDERGFERLDPCRALHPNARYYDVAWTAEDELWVASNVGLARVTAAEERVFQRKDGLRHPRVFTLLADEDGTLWFGHQESTRGIGRVHAGGTPEYVEPSDDALEPHVSAMALDAGRLWVGTDSGLLMLEDGLLQRADRRSGLGSSAINSILVDPARLAVGTEGRGVATLSLDPSTDLPPRLQLEDVRIDGSDAEVRWRVSSPFGNDPRHSLYVRYWLDDSPWSRWSHMGGVEFDDLAHGEHRLEVEVASLMHRVRASTTFTVVSPWREMLWLIAPLVTLALGALALAAWSVRRRLREASAHRETSERFEQLASNVRDVFWLVDWRARRVLYVSPAFETLFDLPRATLDGFGRKWLECLHPDERTRVITSYREDIERTGSWDHEFRVVRRDGRIGWIHARAFAIRSPEGEVVRVAGVAEEITERRESEQHQTLLSLELDHRVKNSLAQVVGLAEQTLRATQDLPRFREAFLGRLRSLARTHEALASVRWRGISLNEILKRSVAGLVEPNRLALHGPPVALTARVSSALGLSLHELATNALKYGALRRDAGRIEVTWATGPAQVLELVWREHGGDAVEPPTRQGLGTKLIRGMIEHELGGAVSLEFRPEGLYCQMTIPGALEDREPAEASSGA